MDGWPRAPGLLLSQDGEDLRRNPRRRESGLGLHWTVPMRAFFASTPLSVWFMLSLRDEPGGTKQGQGYSWGVNHREVPNEVPSSMGRLDGEMTSARCAD